jgi:hypothetical protein
VISLGDIYKYIIILILLFVNTIPYSVRADTLYVATNGNDITGDGSELYPWKTITHGLSQINGTQTNPIILYVKSGTYAPSTTGELFPINVYMKNYISLTGEDLNTTILDAENSGSLFQCQNIQNFTIENFTMTNGLPRAIGCVMSTNFIIRNNVIENIDRGLFAGEGAIKAEDGAEVIILNNIIQNNNCDGLVIGPSFGAVPVLKGNIIRDNLGHSQSQGGGIYIMLSQPNIGNALEDANDIYNNSPYNIDGWSPYFIQATYNYWGSDDFNIITQTINFDSINLVPYTDSTHTLVFNVNDLPEITSSKSEKFRLFQNYPNPFNPSSKIKYYLPKPENVKIEVFNMLGQKIESLINKSMAAGLQEVEFTAKNLPSGIYLYQIEAGEFQHVKKMILLR